MFIMLLSVLNRSVLNMNPQSQNRDFEEQICTQAPQARPEHHSLSRSVLFRRL